MEELKSMSLDDIRAICYKIIDAIDFVKLMERTPNCNTCKMLHDCRQAPMPGQQVRYNCFMWRGDPIDISELSPEERAEIEKAYLEDQLKRKL